MRIEITVTIIISGSHNVHWTCFSLLQILSEALGSWKGEEARGWRAPSIPHPIRLSLNIHISLNTNTLNLIFANVEPLQPGQQEALVNDLPQPEGVPEAIADVVQPAEVDEDRGHQCELFVVGVGDKIFH